MVAEVNGGDIKFIHASNSGVITPKDIIAKGVTQINRSFSL
jgi:hypothetical protein